MRADRSANYLLNQVALYDEFERTQIAGEVLFVWIATAPQRKDYQTGIAGEASSSDYRSFALELM